MPLIVDNKNPFCPIQNKDDFKKWSELSEIEMNATYQLLDEHNQSLDGCFIFDSKGNIVFKSYIESPQNTFSKPMYWRIINIDSRTAKAS